MMVKRKPAAAASAVHYRCYPRVALEAEVTIDSEHNFYVGLSENLSEGGIFIATYQLAELGAELDLTFSLPIDSDQPMLVKTRGRVQWVREFSAAHDGMPPGVGLQFIDLSPEALIAVRLFVQRRDPAFYE